MLISNKEYETNLNAYETIYNVAFSYTENLQVYLVQSITTQSNSNHNAFLRKKSLLLKMDMSVIGSPQTKTPTWKSSVLVELQYMYAITCTYSKHEFLFCFIHKRGRVDDTQLILC
jgi:hypothetical protein